MVVNDGPYSERVAASLLLEKFDLPVVFQRGKASDVAYRLGGRDICQRLLHDELARSYVVGYSQVRGADPASPWKPLDDLCVYAVEEAPTKPVVTVQASGIQVNDQRAPRTEFETKITDGAGKDHILRSAELSEPLPLPWLSLRQYMTWGFAGVPQGPPFARYPNKLVGAEVTDPTVDTNTWSDMPSV